MKELIKIAIVIVIGITLPFAAYALFCFLFSLIFEPTFQEVAQGFGRVFASFGFIYLMGIGYVFQTLNDILDI